MATTSYDPHAFAAAFLADEPAPSPALHRARVRHLGLAIEQAIDEWLETDTSAMGTPYDPHCQDLAEVFLAEEPVNTQTLGQHTARVRALSLQIQQAIENWLEEFPLDGWAAECPLPTKES